MLKGLAIFGLVLAFALPVQGLGTSSDADHNQAEGTHSKQPQADPAPPPPSVVTCAVKQDASSQQANGAKGQPPSYLSRLFSPENLPNICLAIVGIVGIVIGVCTLFFIQRQAVEMRQQRILMRRTLYTIRRQTRATEDAAKAALLQANHIVATERAWIFQKIQFPNVLPVQAPSGPAIAAVVVFKIKNEGTTPARIRAIQLRFHRVAHPERLPALPYYQLSAMPELGAHGRMMAVGEEWKVMRFLEERPTFLASDSESVANGELGIYAYGLILYETLGQTAYTQFCYRWYEPRGLTSDADQSGFRIDGPAEYNRTT
jgi:hypothetical protein